MTDRAWRSLRDMNIDQCLIFTGEAGSGKTEAMKLSLQYLAAITGHPREFHLTKYQILQSNIILEAFGNAKTRLNDNSSRFVSWIFCTFQVFCENILKFCFRENSWKCLLTSGVTLLVLISPIVSLKYFNC